MVNVTFIFVTVNSNMSIGKWRGFLLLSDAYTVGNISTFLNYFFQLKIYAITFQTPNKNVKESETVKTSFVSFHSKKLCSTTWILSKFQFRLFTAQNVSAVYKVLQEFTHKLLQVKL